MPIPCKANGLEGGCPLFFRYGVILRMLSNIEWWRVFGFWDDDKKRRGVWIEVMVGVGREEGSKVERVKRRRVRKTKRAQIEIVDCAFVNKTLEFVLLIDGIERLLLVVLLLLTILLLLEVLFVLPVLPLLLPSSGKKTRRKPMPQFSLLLLSLFGLAFAVKVKPISLSLFLSFSPFWLCEAESGQLGTS